MDEALQVLARSVVETTAAKACAVVALERPTPAGQGVPSIRTLGTANLPEDWSHRVEALWGTGEPLPPRQALATGRTVVGEPPESMREFTEALGADALTCVPMRSKGLVVGLLSCLYRNLQDLDQAELAFLETVAPLAAVVVDNARLYQEVREQVSLQERQHLARELHDSVSQALYGIGLGARTARTLLEQDPARAASALDYVLALAESGLAEMRALLFELRPESLERGGLVAALEARARAAGSLVVELDLPAEPDLSLEARHGLLRIASEAIHNVVKHARASRLGLSLKLEAGCAALEVCDDGQGFAVGQEAPGHMGLSTMRERAEALGGTLRVESRPGQGTRVVARVPQVPSCAPTLVGVRTGPAPDAGIPGRG
jgi:signal transduction histidine kinase